MSFVQSQRGRIELYFLPGYAPELNPDEFVGSHIKHNGVSKEPLRQNESLRDRVDSDLAEIRFLPALVRSFSSVSHTADWWVGWSGAALLWVAGELRLDDHRAGERAGCVAQLEDQVGMEVGRGEGQSRRGRSRRCEAIGVRPSRCGGTAAADSEDDGLSTEQGSRGCNHGTRRGWGAPARRIAG